MARLVSLRLFPSVVLAEYRSELVFDQAEFVRLGLHRQQRVVLDCRRPHGNLHDITPVHGVELRPWIYSILCGAAVRLRRLRVFLETNIPLTSVYDVRTSLTCRTRISIRYLSPLSRHRHPFDRTNIRIYRRKSDISDFRTA